MNISISNILNKTVKFCLSFLVGITISTTIVAQNKELILADVEKDDLYGIIDTEGNWYIPNIYYYIGKISEGFVQAAINNEEEGFIHLKSKTFIPFECWNKGDKVKGYDNLSIFDYTYLYAFIEDNDTIYKPSKNISDSLSSLCLFCDTIYKPNYTFVNDIAPIWIGPETNNRNFNENGKWGYINKKGEWIIEPICDIGRLPSENYLLITQGEVIKYYGIYSDSIILTQYNSGDTFSEGLACVGKGDSIAEYLSNISFVGIGKWGFINSNGEEIIPLKFDLAFPFSEGYALVQKKGKYGYINHKGELKIPYRFEYSTTFNNGRAGVYIDSLWGIIDKKGDWISTPQYSEFYDYSCGMAVVQINNKEGYIDLNGNWIILPIFQNASSFRNAYQKNCIDCLSPIRYFEPFNEIEFEFEFPHELPTDTY